jgi:hypothetical protein
MARRAPGSAEWAVKDKLTPEAIEGVARLEATPRRIAARTAGVERSALPSRHDQEQRYALAAAVGGFVFEAFAVGLGFTEAFDLEAGLL